MRSARAAAPLDVEAWPLLLAVVGAQWLSVAAAAAWSRPEEPLGSGVVLLNVTLLGPLGLLAALALAREVAGTALALWTTIVWLAGPWFLYAFALPGYRDETRDLVLPLLLGLTRDPGYAAGVAILLAAVLATVSGRVPAAASGVAAGVAVLLVPATAVFAAGLVAALLLARARDAGPAAGALLPFLVVAATWRGVDLAPRSEDAFKHAMGGLREYFWSQRLAQWAPLAGAVGVARRSPPLALALGAGFLGFALLQTSREAASFGDASFFRLLLPGLPALALLVAALPLLVPTLAARLGDRARPAPLR
jgi:hypothetical protein